MAKSNLPNNQSTIKSIASPESQTEEIWRQSISANYEVSNKGNVRGKGKKVLRPYDNFGYKKVALTENGKLKKYFIHVLVMRAFVGEPNGKEVNHINGNRADNRLINLEYLTHQENVQHAKDVLGAYLGESNVMAKLTNDNIRAIRCFIQDGFSGSLIARMFNVTSATISSIKHRKTWNHIT